VSHGHHIQARARGLEILRKIGDLLVEGLLLMAEAVLLGLGLPAPLIVEPLELIGELPGNLLLLLAQALVYHTDAPIKGGLANVEDPLAIVQLALHRLQALALE
jgi:hypothetical protein